MKFPLMTWDRPIPLEVAAEPARVHELLMDHEAFTAFYQRTSRPLWAYLARVCANPTLADDLLQDSYLRFLGSSNLPDGDIACRRYLFQIATNLMRDHWRRRVPAALEEIAEPAVPVTSSSLPEQLDAATLTAEGLQHLRPRERQLLWLAYAEGYTHHEIAGITGLASASIRLLLFRARRKFAGHLRKRLRVPEENA